MDFDMFKNMRAKELKNYLCLRGLKVTGKKDILVARSFAAFENNVAVVKTAEEVEIELKQEYENKLKLKELQLRDPFKLTTGWKNEEEGMSWWPIVPNFYIIQFLMIDSFRLGIENI